MFIKKEKTVHRESDEKCFSSKKKSTLTHKKRETKERCPRLRVETFTREEEMRI
jgi:hypothetical protein